VTIDRRQRERMAVDMAEPADPTRRDTKRLRRLLVLALAAADKDDPCISAYVAAALEVLDARSNRDPFAHGKLPQGYH
jgi:hypothetical protein